MIHPQREINFSSSKVVTTLFRTLTYSCEGVLLMLRTTAQSQQSGISLRDREQVFSCFRLMRHDNETQFLRNLITNDFCLCR